MISLPDRIEGLKTRPGVPAANRAFTRVELLAVVAVVALLAALFRPTRANTQTTSAMIGCLYNLRQLALAWSLYAEDYQGALVGNSEGASTAKPWVRGFMDFSPANPANFNKAYLTNGQNAALGPYTRRAELYHCPADLSRVVVQGHQVPRVRSYSMNAAVGHDASGIILPSPPYRLFKRLADTVAPKPADLWLFLEEHTESINDGSFFVIMPTSPATARLVDYPAAFHDGACGIVFADGRAILRQWTDPRTSPVHVTGVLPVPNDADVLWLAQHTSSP